ncbi:MAG: malonate decarboxylase holo-[acyl-carrier-protein] synthase, partial [Oligosphaeraceae bacterium]|nr:malonate decarboxylase holo-[acyl-carrier-protein] synthase [Oligosphaeraceae bacterium]
EIRNWLEAGFPVIVRRPGTTAEGIHCGIPLPISGGLRRIPFRVRQEAVQKRLALPRLQECLAELPQARAVSEKLLAINPEVFGSLAWQHLTGLEYLHAGSDLDLLIRVRNPGELQALLRALPGIAAPFCDLEIMLWHNRSFSWREWMTATSAILVKSDQQVFLLPKCLLTGDLPDSAAIAAAAGDALREELEAYPKPGLVSFLDNGSHEDMTATHFNNAIAVLPEFFRQLAEAGAGWADFAALQQTGWAAEQKMLQATGGINTHRGAIFALGLLCAAAGRKFATGSPLRLGEIIRDCWGGAILQSRNPGSHGDQVLRQFGVRGAAGEAAAGFPAVYRLALPALCSLPERNAARMQAFFALLGTVNDTTLLHRGGTEGRDFAARAAADFLRSGGAGRSGWAAQAAAIHQTFINHRWSCGGIADLLAAAIFIQAMEGKWQV